ncbi:UNVERIFIED_CONTAM: Synaptotagmin-3 [Sesamum indicum]
MVGFGIGIPIGLFLGFFMFIYFRPRNVKKSKYEAFRGLLSKFQSFETCPGLITSFPEGVTRSLNSIDSNSMIDIVPELPLWVMNPDYERVDWLNKFIIDMWPYFDKSIKNTRNPVWNEEFQFLLDEAPVKDKIHIEVIAKRRRRLGFMTKESLGYVDINLADVVYNGHINEKYSLINSRDGSIHLVIRWKVI